MLLFHFVTLVCVSYSGFYQDFFSYRIKLPGGRFLVGRRLRPPWGWTRMPQLSRTLLPHCRGVKMNFPRRLVYKKIYRENMKTIKVIRRVRKNVRLKVAAYVTRQTYPYECTDEQSLNSCIDEYYNYYEHGPDTDEYNYLDENEPDLMITNVPPGINHQQLYPPQTFNEVPYNRLHPGRIRKNDYRYDSYLMTDDYNLYDEDNEDNEDNEEDEDEEKEEDKGNEEEEENEEDEDEESGHAWQNFLSHLSRTEVLPKLFGTVSNTDRNQRRENVDNDGFRPREYENGNKRRYNNNADNNERIILGSERMNINLNDPESVSNTRRRQTNNGDLAVSVPVSVDEGSSDIDVGNWERRTRNSSGTVASASGDVRVAVDENALQPVEISAGASGSIGINTGKKKECKQYEKKDKKKTDCKKKPPENKKDEKESENSLKCFCKDYEKYGNLESLKDDDDHDEYKGEPEVIIKRKKGCKEKRKTDDDAGGGSPLAQGARILIDKGVDIEQSINNAIVDNTLDYSKLYDAFVENQPLRLSPKELETYNARKYIDHASGFMKNQLFGRNNDGDNKNNVDVNKNDARDIFHHCFRNRYKGTNNFELKPRNLNPLSKFSRKRPPKCSHKLKIEAGPLSCRFTINGRRCSENNVKCVVVDSNNCVYDFDNLTKDIQCKILEGGLSEGSVFLCYPPKEITVEENSKDTAELLLIKSVLYHWVKNIIDVCFDSPYLANRCRSMFHSMIRGH